MKLYEKNAQGNNPYWTQILNHPCRTLTAGSLRLGKNERITSSNK